MTSLIRSQLDEKMVSEFVIEMGIMETKIGDLLENRPSKIIKTPASVFLNEEFLSTDYFNLFNPQSTKLDLKMEEFLNNLFYKEILENADGSDVYLIINLFVPTHIINCIQNILLKRMKVRAVYAIPSQICALYTSLLESGILIDFSFTNISFIPFYKGFVLQKFIRKSSKSGVTLFKKLHESVKNYNPRYEEKEFDVKMELLNQTLVECISIPTLDEYNLLQVNFNEEKEKMRSKIITCSGNGGVVHISFIENYKVGNHFFEDDLNVAMEFLEFLMILPSNLQLLLIKNIIPTGGLVLLNNMFRRFKDELLNLILTNEDLRNRLSDDFVNNFHFSYTPYMSSLLHFGGCILISVGLAENHQTRSQKKKFV